MIDYEELENILENPINSTDKMEELIQSLNHVTKENVLEILGDMPSGKSSPPENFLFICKLNKLTQEKDLSLIFSQFGKVLSCKIVKDWKTNDSLQYGFIEFETKEACEAAYFKMDNILIDNHRIKVDFSQSVSTIWNKYQKEKFKSNN